MIDASSAQENAKQRPADRAMRPEGFGFTPFQHGWLREFAGFGTVAFAPVAWPHTQVKSFYDDPAGRVTTNALALLVHLQEETWGFPPAETVPVNVLATTQDTGGAVVVAYDLAKGWNSAGWLGFAIGMGTRSGVLYSHMLGVREEMRGVLDLGWYLKVLQGHLALQSGHHAMTWTFDPLRGVNARLNTEKLAARMMNLTLDKYGVMHSSLYGDVPTDRFSAYWDLLDPTMHERLQRVLQGTYFPLRPADILHVPEATIATLGALMESLPPAVKYRIPGDIDQLMRQNPESAIHWRHEMRQVLGTLMTQRAAQLDEAIPSQHPIAVGKEVTPGPYIATGFATANDGHAERASYYLLTLKGEDAK